MKIIIHFITIVICFHFYNLKIIKKTNNWDDEFLSCFKKETFNLVKAASMVRKCIENPQTFDQIDNLCDAIKHYKANTDGKSVPATDNLIEHMKDYDNCILRFMNYKYYIDVKKELRSIIKDKIKVAKKEKGNKGTEVIKSAEGSYRGAWYLTIGSYAVNIEYKQTVDLSKTKFDFQVHFYGEDLWDFSVKDCEDKSLTDTFICLLDNLLDEIAPDIVIGSGNVYKVSYDFYDTISVDTNSLYLEEEQKEEEVCRSYDNSKNVINNLLLIIIFCLFLN